MKLTSSQELKQLQIRKVKLAVEVDSLNQDLKEVQVNHAKAKGQLQSINSQIQTLKKKEKDVTVTEHAFVRFFERYIGFDLKEITNQILSEKVKLQIKTLGSGKYPIGEGCKAVIQNNAVVTIEKKSNYNEK